MTCTPRSPILLKLKPGEFAESPRSFARKLLRSCRCRSAGAGLDQIAQNFPIVARLPGGRTARFSRCRRPLPLIIEPRFSAKPNEGKTAVAQRVASFCENIHDDECRELRRAVRPMMPSSSGFSPRAISALIWPDAIASSICGKLRAGLAALGRDQARAVRVRIAIFAQQNVVARSACAARCRAVRRRAAWPAAKSAKALRSSFGRRR